MGSFICPKLKCCQRQLEVWSTDGSPKPAGAGPGHALGNTDGAVVQVLPCVFSGSVNRSKIFKAPEPLSFLTVQWSKSVQDNRGQYRIRGKYSTLSYRHILTTTIWTMFIYGVGKRDSHCLHISKRFCTRHRFMIFQLRSTILSFTSVLVSV